MHKDLLAIKVRKDMLGNVEHSSLSQQRAQKEKK
jgi:hypothetical protein